LFDDYNQKLEKDRIYPIMGAEAGNLCSLAVLSYQTGWHHNSKTKTPTIKNYFIRNPLV